MAWQRQTHTAAFALGATLAIIFVGIRQGAHVMQTFFLRLRVAWALTIFLSLAISLPGCGSSLDISSRPQTAPADDPNATLDANATTAPVATHETCAVDRQDANGLGGPSICCSGRYAVCDDFEAQTPGQSPNGAFWEVENLASTYGRTSPMLAQKANVDSAAVIEVSSARAARGKQSLHIRAQNSNTLPNNGWHHNMLVNRSIFPAPNNTFWGRAFIYYVSDANSSLPNGHVTYADASGNVSGSKSFYTWWRVSSFGTFSLNCEHGDQGVGTSTRLPTNRWACLEWQYRGDANNTFALFLDGNQLATTTALTATSDNPSGHAPVYDAFRLGWEVYGYQYNPTPKMFDMYYDEVALDYNRIGCRM
jgi:hypothetical protein